MKNQTVNRKSETLEDIVFEGRNKAYGAYEMNRRRGRTMISAFLISLIFAATAVAVPFINAHRTHADPILLKGDKTIEITDVNTENPLPPVPPLPPPIENMEKHLAYATPEFVENANPDEGMLIFEDALIRVINPPEDIMPVEPVNPGTDAIDEPVEEPVPFPQESARFRGGDINEFRKWVVENITYPAIAVEAGIFGKVIIEFCVNSKGEVVDLKLLRKLDPLVDEETLRVISLSPKWTPAKQGGRPVKQRFTLPFMFQMQ